MAETLLEIRTLVRDLSGRQSTSEISDSTLNDDINNWYQNKLPAELSLSLQRIWELSTLPDDDLYSVAEAYQILTGYVTIDDVDLEFFVDPQAFNDNYGDSWMYESAIETGDGSTTAFSGTLSGSGKVVPGTLAIGDDTETFTDDSAGTLTGSAGGSGTINYSTLAYTLTFNAAPSNGTNVSAHYAVYTAAKPLAVLYFNEQLKFRPIPDGTYEVRIQYELRPTALSSDSDEPIKPYWGDLISYGTAIDILERYSDRQGAAELKQEYKRILDVCCTYAYRSFRKTYPRPAW